MKNILIFNVPAEELGALTILNKTFDDLIKSDDKEIKYHFILSGPYITKKENIEVTVYPWVKKSWIHRIFFDYCVAPKIVKMKKADVIISYHNLVIPLVDTKQTLYIHNAIPFTDLSFSLFKEPKLWIYKNIMSRKIISSIKKADKLIVQSEWLKNKILNRFRNIKPENIVVENNKEIIKNEIQYNNIKREKKLFIFPAGAFSYKNHMDIIEACKLLKKETSYEIIFTISGHENKVAKLIKKQIEMYKLPIILVGSISHKRVLEYFKTHTLIFPSNLETLGLPLLEAKSINTPIIYKNSDLYKEVLDGYEFAESFTTIIDLKNIIKR
ncbi:glycosyltransferase [Exiguobacterium sp. 22311]|uniref:glycosyltransferase n=1 Tax=Exiguobacterium sp. 22311 TaxID=3453907 RepID=UPI003F8377E1